MKGELAAVLDGTNITEEQMRSAGTVLAAQALDAAGGDWDAAGAILRPLLEAIGALSYETGLPRGWTGRPVQLRENGARR